MSCTVLTTWIQSRRKHNRDALKWIRFSLVCLVTHTVKICNYYTHTCNLMEFRIVAMLVIFLFFVCVNEVSIQLSHFIRCLRFCCIGLCCTGAHELHALMLSLFRGLLQLLNLINEKMLECFWGWNWETVTLQTVLIKECLHQMKHLESYQPHPL